MESPEKDNKLKSSDLKRDLNSTQGFMDTNNRMNSVGLVNMSAITDLPETVKKDITVFLKKMINNSIEDASIHKVVSEKRSDNLKFTPKIAKNLSKKEENIVQSYIIPSDSKSSIIISDLSNDEVVPDIQSDNLKSKDVNGQSVNQDNGKTITSSTLVKVENGYECFDCSTKFKTKNLLKNHISQIHKDSHNGECEICHMKYKRRSGYKKHEPSCPKYKKYKCDFCNKAYKYRAYLVKHFKIHKRSDSESSNIVNDSSNKEILFDKQPGTSTSTYISENIENEVKKEENTVQSDNLQLDSESSNNESNLSNNEVDSDRQSDNLKSTHIPKKMENEAKNQKNVVLFDVSQSELTNNESDLANDEVVFDKQPDNLKSKITKIENKAKKIVEKKSVLRSSDQSKKLTNVLKKINFEDDLFSDLMWYNRNRRHYKIFVDIIFGDYIKSESTQAYYNYLLLDSRKCPDLMELDWQNFIKSIFYIGKGKDGRCHDHTKCAKRAYLAGTPGNTKKDKKILDIWRSEEAVIMLRVADMLTEQEAFTREALLIDAIGKSQLCNKKSGTYHGRALTLLSREKRTLGAVLLARISKNNDIKKRPVYVYLKNSKTVIRKSRIEAA